MVKEKRLQLAADWYTVSCWQHWRYYSWRTDRFCLSLSLEGYGIQGQ